MRYFYDFEFNEDGKAIEPISIGVVSEDGREFYNVFRFDVLKAWRDKWLRENVLKQIFYEHTHRFTGLWGDPTTSDLPDFDYWNMRRLIKEIGLSRHEVAERLLIYFRGEKPELWGYYADYDHVALCQLFGRMVDMPKILPWYTMDLKQWAVMLGDPDLPKQSEGEHNALADAKWNKLVYEFLKGLS